MKSRRLRQNAWWLLAFTILLALNIYQARALFIPARSAVFEVPRDPRLLAKLQSDVPNDMFEIVCKQLAASSGIPFNVDYAAIQRAEIHRSTQIPQDFPRGITLEDALHRLNHNHPETRLVFAVHPEGLTLTTHDDARSQRYRTERIYPINDLVVSATFSPSTYDDQLRDLMSVIVAVIDAETWAENGGTSGFIRVYDGNLAITQTYANQARIESLLTHLRQNNVREFNPATQPIR